MKDDNSSGIGRTRATRLALRGALAALIGAGQPLVARTSQSHDVEAAAEATVEAELQWAVARPMEFRVWHSLIQLYLREPRAWGDGSEPPHPDLARPELVQFVDSTFRLGVRAWVVPDSGEWLQSDAHGWTWIPLELQRQHVWVYAEGCYPREFESGSLQRKNSMSPSCWSILQVVTPDGTPAAELDVTWWSEYETHDDRYEPLLGSGGQGVRTTSEGFSWIATARASFVALGGTETFLWQALLLPNCASVVTEPPRPLFMLRLVPRDVDEGYVHSLVSATAPAERLDFPQTSHNGHLDHLSIQPRVGPVVVELLENRYAPAESLPAGWTRLGPTKAAFWGVAGPDARGEFTIPTAELPVDQNATWLWLAGSEGRASWTSPVRYRVLHDATARGSHADEFTTVPGNYYAGLSLPESVTAELRDEGASLEVWPFGARPRVLSYDEVKRDGEQSTRVEFERARIRLIRVVDRSGRDFHPRLRIAREDGALYRDDVDKRGTYPLDWIGGDVIVRAELPAADAEPGATVELARIPAALLENGLGVDLHVGLELGTVDVTGAKGSGTDIVLVDHAGEEHRPARRDADGVTFVDVPPGPLVVAPRRWADQWWARREAGGTGASKRLGSGELLRIPWDANWSTEHERSGSVRYAPSSLHGLFLVPCYGSPYEPVPLDLEAHWISIDYQGEYKIPKRDPVPTALLVCSIPEDGGVFSGELGKLLVHDVIETGESVDLPLGELELVWDAEEWDGPVRVTWQQSRGKCRHPLADVLASNATTRCGAAWPEAENRVLRRLDPGALTLHFESTSKSWTATVDVEAGERVELRVRP